MRLITAALALLGLATLATSDVCVCTCNSAYPSSAEQAKCDRSTTCTQDFCATQFSECNSTSVFVDPTCQASVPDASMESLFGTYNVQPGLDCLEPPDGELGVCVPKCDQYSDLCDCLIGQVIISPGSSNTTFMVQVTAVGHNPLDGPAGPTMTTNGSWSLTGPATAYGNFEFDFNGSAWTPEIMYAFTRDPDGKQMIIRVPSLSPALGCQVVVLLEGADKVDTWKLILFIGLGVVFLGLSFLFYKKCCSDDDSAKGKSANQLYAPAAYTNMPDN